MYKILAVGRLCPGGFDLDAELRLKRELRDLGILPSIISEVHLHSMRIQSLVFSIRNQGMCQVGSKTGTKIGESRVILTARNSADRLVRSS